MATSPGPVPDREVLVTNGFVTHRWVQWLNAVLSAVNEIVTGIKSGPGAPNGSVIGNVGDLYRRTDGGAGTTLYVKESGAATNTGWTGK